MKNFKKSLALILVLVLVVSFFAGCKKEEKKTGVISREIPNDAHHFKMYFENKYGVWSHVIVRFR